MPDSAPPRVLIVDDNDAGRYVLVRTLRHGGYDVLEAATGRTALDVARDLPSAIILDVNLPDMSGFEVARLVRAEEETAHVPILMVSAAHLSSADRVMGLEGGADAYLTHPIEPTVLLATVRALLRTQSAEANLRELNEALERTVAERTTQLEERNAALEAQARLLARQKQALELANQDLEAFAYSVSHDLRTPVRHISGFTTLLRRRLERYPDEQAHAYMNTIESAAHTMNGLIEALLTLSRASREELRFERVDVQRLVRDIQADLHAHTHGRDVTWRVKSLPLVWGDARLLRSVMQNLLENAVKYTRHTPNPVIEVWSEASVDEDVIFVRDNGVGFDPRYEHKLFGVFQRLHHERDFEGTGVGLANVKRVVVRHGGRVWAEGHVGQGALFGFSLPKAP
ncbi:sensor histidine kinase [Deinococcus yavapaiensis]|uniref:histidine kinase n=1 Tax=Deinococcus yavapaiensis KR-236 TaxID=694435 RepID=A0A318SMP2_9DEIO|nr:ATP-binding protein [Deinococcus yavapaiensis]PYE53811.1 phospho-acceptor domain-containing protein [Deinococcus yavapaiensis KR-236]